MSQVIARLCFREPLDQLRLVSAELDRELADLAVRQANAITRSSIILAAAGVTGFTSAGGQLILSAAPAFLSLASAVLAFAAIRYWPSRAIKMKRSHVKSYLDTTAYLLLWRQLADKFDELDMARRDLKRKTRFLTFATVALLLAWVSYAATRFFIEPAISGVGY